MTIQDLMDSLTAVGAIKEMIVVVPTATNAYAESFYSNSPVIANWENYISRELVAWVDSVFRTIPAAVSRGVAGHSMSGLGAVIMAMRHSDVFSVAYAMSPCCLAMVGEIGIRLDYGFDDQFIHIPPATRLFADSLGAYHIPYRLDAYLGDHRNQIRARMTTIVLPFFSAALSDSQ